MKNKIVLFGSLCLVLALGLVFVGCNNVQDVQFTFQAGPENVSKSYSAPKATWVTTPYSMWSSDNGELTVNWTAAEGATSGVTYDVVISQDDKRNFYVIGSGNFDSWSDIDKIVAEITTHDISTSLNDNYKSVITFTAKWPGTWKIGVIAKSGRSDINNSDIVWANDGATESFSDVSFTQP